MPFFRNEHTKTHYKFENFGHNQTMVFSNSLGTTLSMWNKVVGVLKNHFNILRYDTRGHGKSQLIHHADEDMPEVVFNIADLGNDVIDLMNYLGLEKVHFCGLSMGGLIGQGLGMCYPERFYSITLANTAAKIGNDDSWNGRIAMVQNEGFEHLATATEGRWFTEGFRKKSPKAVANIIGQFKQNSISGYCDNCAAIRRADFRNQLQHLEVPTLIISGGQDAVTTVADAQYLCDNIPVAKHVTLPAAHLSAVEQWAAFADLLIKQKT